MFKKFNDLLDKLLIEQTEDEKYRFIPRLLNLRQCTNKLDPIEAQAELKSWIAYFLADNHHSKFDLDDYKNTLYSNYIDLEGGDYIFKVTFQESDDRLVRTIRIPSSFSLADLGYAILASMNSGAYHLFKFEYNDNQFVCTYDFIHEKIELITDIKKIHYAHDVFIGQFKFEKGDKLDFIYDYGDYWEFDVEFIGIESRSKNICILDGKGYGIIEDNKYSLYQFLNGKEDLDFNFDQFCVEQNQKHVNKDFKSIKKGYEAADVLAEIHKYRFF